MNYLSVVVESTGLGSFSTLFNKPVYRLPIQQKREVSDLLKQEGEKLGQFADAQDRLAWEAEIAQIQKEQEQDLATPALAWWKPVPLSEAEYFEMLAEGHKTEAVL